MNMWFRWWLPKQGTRHKRRCKPVFCWNYRSDISVLKHRPFPVYVRWKNQKRLRSVNFLWATDTNNVTKRCRSFSLIFQAWIRLWLNVREIWWNFVSFNVWMLLVEIIFPHSHQKTDGLHAIVKWWRMLVNSLCIIKIFVMDFAVK